MENHSTREGDDLKQFLKKRGLAMGYVADELEMTRQNLNYHLRKEVLLDDFKRLLKDKLNIHFPLENEAENANVTGDELRRRKAFKPTEDKGLIYVPIAAQAGYALHYDQPMFLKDLERLYIPGNPFKGDRFRYFEVEGDSMHPTLIEGMQVIAQRIEPDYWKQISDFYIHVIVTQDRILVKRLYKSDDDTLVMISDNEELYPQQELKYKDVKELWVVKRSLDWRLPPPKQFEVKIGGGKKPGRSE